MIISPPFLPQRNADQSEVAWLDAAMTQPPASLTNTGAPEGSYPLSNKLAWHNGLHLQGHPGTNGHTVVRAIADGDVIYVAQPKQSNDSTADPQNYNPFEDAPAWTDNGCVIIRHTTAIGANGAQPTEITYFSLVTHLCQIARITPTGQTAPRPLQTGDRIRRKDEIGRAGQIYGHSGQIHFEICLDEANLTRLIGRPPSWVDSDNIAAPTTDGRVDAVFGSVWFYLPATTPTSTAQPGNHQRATTQSTLGESLWLRMTYEQGDCIVECRTSSCGRFLLPRQSNAEYDLYVEANRRHNSLPQAVRTRSSPSGWYELLRFGRNLGRGPAQTDKDPLPADVAHWREIPGPNGRSIWADLNAEGTYKFSDADFLPICGWNFVNDDTNPDDQRCDSNNVKNLIADPDTHRTDRLKTDRLALRLGDTNVAEKLRRLVCRFPSELDQTTINARYAFVRELQPFIENPDAWTDFESHLSAISFSNLPAEYTSATWHVHPNEFIAAMRKCGWLSRNELELIYPNDYEQKQGNAISTASNALNEATRERFRNLININIRKYFINDSAARLSHYFGQGAEESRTLTMMSERRSEASCNQIYSGRMGNDQTGDGYLFRGRGMKQITGKYNYSEYWVYRGWLDRRSYTDSWWNAAKTATRPLIDDPERVLTDTYSTIDTGGWYWTASPHRGAPHRRSSINILAGDDPPNNANIETVTRGINGGTNGLDNRIHHTLKIYRIFSDVP
ncbi:M23 family metallopeptidase [Aromatoleum toluclasticum]|uniref:M23 family metallopeptidase n=1 Tax=Aromatoleum toluclasticum TaxID=92003 RepID=UPI001D18815D|nr:M23 family metallopeptidase [Aromatoleum toluclasticum]MCC4114395.1 M23 family metallopeptidase [Aromatoleum toluclasticum]